MDYKKPQSTLVQGGAGIYPLTTADQVILADGSRLEKDGRISADSAANSAKLGGKAPEYYIQPRNLLDNSNFRNPVNQRGIAYGGTLNSGYTIDRWYYQQSAGAGDGYFGLTEYYVSLKAPSDGYSQMYQNLERYSAMKGKTYTFATSIRYGNNAESVKAVTFTMGAIDTGLILTEDGNVKLYSVDGMNVLIRVTGQNEYAFTWAALYEGSYTADTLPPYVPKGYAVELAECDLHYRPLGDNVMSVIAMTSSDGGVVLLKSIRPMRDSSAPTIINNGTLYARVNGIDYTLTDVRILKSNKSGVEILANASGAPSKQTAMIHGSALLALSRDL